MWLASGTAELPLPVEDVSGSQSEGAWIEIGPVTQNDDRKLLFPEPLNNGPKAASAA